MNSSLKNYIACCILSFLSITVFSQQIYYAVYFKDKCNVFESSESSCLSPEAIVRRIKHNIEFDKYDIPVNKYYINILSNKGLNIKFTSKWLNCAVVDMTDILINHDSDLVIKYNSDNKQYKINNIISELLSDCSFVSEINCVGIVNNNNVDNCQQLIDNRPEINVENRLNVNENIDDRDSTWMIQYEIVNGLSLHKMGYLGDNVNIAIMDDGFLGADKLQCLNHLFDDGKIIISKNLLDNGNIYNLGSGHGSSMLTLLAANADNFTGSAPEANYMFFRTEDYYHENLLEEYAWVKAAEIADSIGVDVISSSQNYTTMDDPSDSHTYKDMDGKTCPISIGAEIAASKGILVVSSAGNDGASAWKYVSAPADAVDVISVGGINSDGTHWLDSSVGPTYDGRIKPDICALSSGVISINPVNGYYFKGSGTSYAAPVVAGFLACLIQAFPEVSSSHLKEVVYHTSSNSLNPNVEIGNGIPNFSQVYHDVGINEWEREQGNVIAYPNPFDNNLTISSDEAISSVKIYSVYGEEIPFLFTSNNGTNVNLLINTSYKGIVYLYINVNNKLNTILCVKL